MSEELIKHMAQRFLMWKLPAHFHPDAGISFQPEYNVEYNAKHGRPPQRHEPCGTNLIGYDDAIEMVRYMLVGTPDSLLDRMAEALRWFNDRRFVLRAKFDLHGPSDTAAALDEALTNVLAILAEYDAKERP